MKILLDTCTFLWITAGSKELSSAAREMFEDPKNEVLLSVASAWEISIKYGLKKLSLPDVPEKAVPMLRKRYGVESLPVTEEVALHVRQLPPLHTDPFDRLLVAQALLEELTLLTPDSHISQYGLPVVW